MILKGGSVGGGGLASHLQKEENEAVRIIATEGILSQTIDGMTAEIRARAVSITKKGAFHVAISAQPGCPWGDAEKRQAIDAVLKEYRAEGAPYFVVGHQKDTQGVGRDEHLHIIISRIDSRGRVVDDGYTRVRNEKVGRCVEHDLGHPLTVGKHNKAVAAKLRTEGRADVAEWMAGAGAQTAPRPTAAITHAEAQQQTRTKVTKAQAAAEILAGWRESDCGNAFRAALADRGYSLAHGDKRPDLIMVVDPAGGDHELTNALQMAMKAEGTTVRAATMRAGIDAKTGDLDRAALPSLSAARATAREGDGLSPPASPVQAAPTAEAVLLALTEQLPTFTVADIDRALAAVVDQAERAAIKAQILAHVDVLTITLDDDGTRRMTTREMAAVEAQSLSDGEALAARRIFALDPITVDAAIKVFTAEYRAEKGHDLGDSQIAAIRDAAIGADLCAWVGVAGSGKSTAARYTNRLWTDAGLAVVGIAPTGIASERLGDAGIDADTIHARLAAWDAAVVARRMQQTGAFTPESRKAVLDALAGWKANATKRGTSTAHIDAIRHQVETANRVSNLDKRSRKWLDGWIARQTARDLTARTVVVMDEAGMANHRLGARVQAHVNRADAKLALIGDPEQIQPISAGAWYRLLIEKVVRPVELRDVHRQAEQWQRDATVALAAGKPAEAAGAVRTYAEHGCVITAIRSEGVSVEQIAEAEDALERPLTEDERRQIDQVTAYMLARTEAGTLWRQIPTDRPANVHEHPLYPAFEDAQNRRSAAALALTGNLDATRPWLGRYRIDGKGLAADLIMAGHAPPVHSLDIEELASAGTRRMTRDEAEAAAGALAEELGVLDLDADYTLSIDWRAGARDTVLADWRADLKRDGLTRPDDTPISRIIMSYTRADSARLNGAARQVMREMGHLTGEDVEIITRVPDRDRGVETSTMAVAIGDRVLCLQNNRCLGVKNGSAGTITAIDRAESGAVLLRLHLDNGREVTVDTSAWSALQHAYSVNVNRCQGVTVDRAWLLSHGLLDRHLAYVALSRHREQVKVFSAAIDAITTEIIAKQFSVGRTMGAISDYVDVRQLVRAPAAALAAAWRARPSAIAQFTTAIITTTKGIIHGAYTHARALGDAFRLPVALRQLDAVADAAGSTAAAADRLRDVSRLAVARDAQRSPVLLPRDAADQLGQRESRGIDDLRRADLRGRAVEPATTELTTTRKEAMPMTDIDDRPHLADETQFEAALQAYQRALVSGADPDHLRLQRADLLARAEAINAATGGHHPTAALWAAEARATDTTEAAETFESKI